ncbi:hypothetical protein THAOC_33524, partial [Thalassiosira oceanica]
APRARASRGRRLRAVRRRRAQRQVVHARPGRGRRVRPPVEGGWAGSALPRPRSREHGDGRGHQEGLQEARAAAAPGQEQRAQGRRGLQGRGARVRDAFGRAEAADIRRVGRRGPGQPRRGMRRGGAHFNGQEVSPEDIFNMFFGGGMPGGMHAGGGNGFRFLPLLMILLLSFLNSPGDKAAGGNRYFSLTPISPHTNQLGTKLSKVKDIPYYVSDTFLRTVARDRYQLSQVERMVESSYEQYLRKECDNQRRYRRKLEDLSKKTRATEKRAELARRASNFEMPRCDEWADLFGGSTGTAGGGAASQQQRRQQKANHGEL